MRLLAEDPRIVLRCPSCGATWSTEIVLFGTWWGKGVTPASIAEACHCPYCHALPPMQPAPPEPLRFELT